MLHYNTTTTVYIIVVYYNTEFIKILIKTEKQNLHVIILIQYDDDVTHSWFLN